MSRVVVPEPGGAGLAPGGDLAAWVEKLDPEVLDPAGLMDAVGACTRLESWASAVRAKLMVQFENLTAASGLGTFGHTELACELRWPERATQEYVERARVLVEQLPGTLAAWQGGVLSAKHAAAIADVVAASGLPPEVAAGVEEQVLERAGERTVAQLRRVVHATVDRADPTAASRRHEERKAQRSLRVCPRPDGMSILRANLDAACALVLYGQVSTYARRLRSGDPQLGPDQARADALTTLVATGFDALTSTGGSEDDSIEPLPTRVQVNVTVGWDVLAGITEEPGHLHGHGPIPADQARALAFGPDATWRRLLTDPVDPTNLNLGRTRYRPPVDLAAHVRAVDTVCIFPTCNQPAENCQLDHNEAYGDPSGEGPGGETSAANLGPLCAFHHNAKTHGGWTWTRDPATGEITWTTPSGKTYRNPRP